MKVYTIPAPENTPELIQLSKYKKAKDYIFQGMKLLGCGFRDMSVICGYKTEAEYQVFLNKLRKGHRMKTKSALFGESKRRIDHEILKKIKQHKESKEKTA
jgi:hypothetical protein